MSKLVTYAEQGNYEGCLSTLTTNSYELNSALHLAAENGHVSCVQLLLNSKADPNFKFQSGGSTPLLKAVKNGHSTCVEVLLKSGSDPNYKDYYARNALHYASKNNHTNSFQLLLDRSTPLDSKGNFLHRVSHHDRTHCMQLLLEYGTDPNSKTHNGETPLYIASYWGYINCLQLLLKAGADPNALNKKGWSSLHIASKCNHTKCVQLLLDAKANPHIKNNEGHIAKEITSDEEIKKLIGQYEIPEVKEPTD